MLRISPAALAVLLLLALPACDTQFSEGGDFNCIDGATASGTIAGRAFTADCVESGDGDGVFFVGAYQNYGEARTDPEPGRAFGSFRLQIDGTTTGTYALTRTGETRLDYFYSPGDDVDNRSTDVHVDAASGQVELTTVTADRFAGSLTFSGPERVGDGDGTATGETVTGSVTFSVPR